MRAAETIAAGLFGTVLLASTMEARAVDPLKVMSYNILHGQPCSGGSPGRTVIPRMEFAVQGGPNHEPGLVDLAPDILGMQEVSQIFVDQTLAENQVCSVVGAPPGVDRIDGYEHAGDYLVRRMNGVANARAVEQGSGSSTQPISASPYDMRFVRDNPRILPFVPDLPLPPGDETVSDHAARLANLEIGLAVISRLNIQFAIVRNLPPDGDQPAGTRALLHAILRDPETGKVYDFYDSHLTTSGGDSAATVAQAVDIVQFVTATHLDPTNPARTNPAFFTCDCNALPGSLTHQTFAQAGFVDSFALANPGADGFTGGRGQGCDGTADGRIDYVWAIPDDQGRVPAVLSSAVVMNFQQHLTADQCRVPSDHLGVLTTFDLSDLQ